MRANILIFALASTFYMGCDYCRDDRFRVTMAAPAFVGPGRQASDIHTVEKSFREYLACQRSLPELPTNPGVWSIPGGTITINRIEDRALSLRIFAFGPRAAYTWSGQAERDLLRLAARYGNVTVLPEAAQHNGEERR